MNVFALRGFIFRDIHKTQERSSSNSGYRIQKKCGWKIYSRLKDKFRFNDLLTKSNRTEIQTYKVEERTFGTPCSWQEEEIFTDKCWNFSKKALAQVAAGNALNFFFP